MRTTHAVTLACLLALSGCASNRRSGAKPQQPPSITVRQGADPVDLPGLHHVAALAPGLYSGGEPDGATGYDTLASMGVRTVVCVDGMPPPADIARSVNIRVVHVPIGYDAVPDRAADAVAKALTELEGPFYVHCHHGKHRGPAALAAGAVCAGEITNRQALDYMHHTGTAPEYTGLWRDVERARPVDPAALHAMDLPLPERADLGGMPEKMAVIDRAWDRVKLARDNAWSAPADHPDLAPANDLGLIHDLLRSLHADPEAQQLGPDHLSKLDRAMASAQAAEDAVRANDNARADAAFADLGASCKDCHATYRD